MTEIRLYKLMQTHVGVVNSLVVKLGREELTKKTVTALVIKNIKELLKELE